MDVLLTHGYFLYEDPHELAVMKPYPPLGLLYVNSHLKAHGVDAHLFDTTFARFDALETYLRTERPPVVGHSLGALVALSLLAAGLANVANNLPASVLFAGLLSVRPAPAYAAPEAGEAEAAPEAVPAGVGVEASPETGEPAPAAATRGRRPRR